MRHENELRPYQQRIIKHLYENDQALCVVRPGGGKTVAALTAIKELKRDGIIRSALVIAPKRVAGNVWPGEIEDWSHLNGLLYCPIVGNQKERIEHLRYAKDRDVDLYIIGIDLTAWLIDRLGAYPGDHPIFDLLIIDEISKLRDPTGVRAKLLAKNAARWKLRWGLSGTLRPNSAQDLFMPARVVTNGALWGRSFYQWRQKWFRPADYQGYTWEPVFGAEEELNANIAPYTVTLREDEYPQLPELSVILDYVELPEQAKHTYRVMHDRLFARIEDTEVFAANAAVRTGKLAQIANGFLYDKENITEDKRLAAAIHDEKRAWLEDVVEQATGPTILVYEYLEDLRMIIDVVGRLPYLGAGVSDLTAAAHIKLWNEGKIPFLGLHPAAGGHGLNLQMGGSDMAWVSPTWSPEFWEQTIARIHRSGQKKPVMVRVCVARGTIDQAKLDRVHYKMTAQQAFEKYLARYNRERQR